MDNTSNLSGALTDPCPVCHLKPVTGICVHGSDPQAEDGSLLICYGCGLVQIVRYQMRCALTPEEADWMFERPELLHNVIGLAKMRAVDPMRTGELVREQYEEEQN